MAQFDVFRNPAHRLEDIPFLVILQNRRFDTGGSRFVAPLVRSGTVRSREHYIAPHFLIASTHVTLDVFNLATVPAARLVERVGSLADEDSRAKIIRALDELISQA